jgi:glucosamine-6-phosphate deaminase
MSAAIHIHANPQSACECVADEIESLIRGRHAGGRHAVLGLATGGTPIPLYRELIRRHREKGLSFQNVITFNLDEYLGLEKNHPQSYWHFMHEEFFDHIDLPAANIHLPDGMVAETEIEAHCERYESAIQEAGGIDIQILGIGRTGHIGFNEPGSAIDTRTRRIHLDEITRADAADAFGGIDGVPKEAITMGCGTILDSRHLILLAWGGRKAEIVQKAIEGPIDTQISASYLQTHPSATYHLDPDAASLLR